MTTFVSDGSAIDFTPEADIAPGTVVVQGELIGISARPIPAGTAGSLAVEGVFDFPKAKGAGTAIAVGALVYWHADTRVANTTAAGGKLIGHAVRDTEDDDEKVRVRLNQ